MPADADNSLSEQRRSLVAAYARLYEEDFQARHIATRRRRHIEDASPPPDCSARLAAARRAIETFDAAFPEVDQE